MKACSSPKPAGRSTRSFATCRNGSAISPRRSRGISIEVISSLVCERFDAAIARFHASHPEVQILIDITTWGSMRRLRDEIDICVAPAQVLRSDLKYDFLFDEVHKAYCGRGHPLYGKRSIAPRRSRRRLRARRDEPDSLTAYRTRHGLGVHVAGLSEHLDEAKRLTLGIGICFLPEAFAAPDVARTLWPLLAAA